MASAQFSSIPQSRPSNLGLYLCVPYTFMVRIAIHVFGLIKTLPSQPSTPPSTSFLATICGGVGTSNVNSTPTGKDGGQPQDHCSGLARRFCMTITQRVGMRKIWTSRFLHPKWHWHTPFDTITWKNALNQTPSVHPIWNPKPPLTGLHKSYGLLSSINHILFWTFVDHLCLEQTSPSNVPPSHTFENFCTSTSPSHYVIQVSQECWDPGSPPNWWVVVYPSVHSVVSLDVTLVLNPKVSRGVPWTWLPATWRFRWCDLHLPPLLQNKSFLQN